MTSNAIKPRQTLILAAMVATVIGLAINPVLALWLASAITSTNAPVAGPYAAASLVIICGTVGLAYALGFLVSAYNAAVGHTAPPARTPSPWQSAAPSDPGNKVLGHVLLMAFSLVGVAGGIWFFFFAGSSI